jgi:hypothetical protein
MHSTQAPRAKRPVRKQTRDQKQQCVGGQQIIRQRVHRSERDNDADQSNHGQANADHRGRDSKDVDANVLFQVAVCTAFRLRFSLHRPVLRLGAKATVQRIARLIEELKAALTKTAFEIH